MPRKSTTKKDAKKTVEDPRKSSYINKKIRLKLVGLDGNAFNLMGAFLRQAEREKWTKQEIDDVMEDAMSGDYENLLCVLSTFCVDFGM